MDKAPLGSFGFKVSIGGGDLSLFQEVSGLGIQINVTDLPEGGMNYSSHKVLGNASFSDVTLKRGLIGPEMYAWIRSVVDSGDAPIVRRTVTIEMLNDKGKTAKVFQCLNAVPVKWDGPTLNVMQDAIATETLVIAIEGLVAL